jgi:ubiquinone biosynthesis protein
MPPTYTMVFKALMTVEGIGKTIAPDMDFLAEAQPFVERMMVERYSLERLTAQAVETLSGLSRLLRIAPDAGLSFVESVRQGTFTVVVEPRGLDKLVAAQRAGARLQAAALGFVGCILGLGMLYGRPGPTVSGYHVLPVLFAVAALFFAIPLVRVVLARWK